MARADGFAVNILHAEQKPHCLSFARPGGDKFAGVRWRPGAGGAPILEDVLA